MGKKICAKGEFARMLEALSNVRSEYMMFGEYDDETKKHLKKVGAGEKDLEAEIHEQLERVFAYEFYHQWAKLLECTYNVKDIMLNGEQKKLTYDWKDQTKEERRHPDMVLHGGQSYWDNQLIVCELKRSEGLKNKNGFEKDFGVLNSYLTHLKFEIGVFLIVNKTIDDLRYDILSYGIRLISECHRGKLYIVSVTAKGDNSTPSIQYIKLSDFSKEQYSIVKYEKNSINICDGHIDNCCQCPELRRRPLCAVELHRENDNERAV